MFISLLISLPLIVFKDAKCQALSSSNMSISDLNAQYERGITNWENGEGRAAFLALDSLRKVTLSEENALVKSKGMIYLAKCFYSQKNFPNTINYLTLALNFGQDTLSASELITTYDLLSSCYHELKNNSQELYYSQLKKVLTDSIHTANMQLQVDSLKRVLEEQKKIKQDTLVKAEESSNDTFFTSTNTTTIAYIVSAFVLILTIVFIATRKKSSATSYDNKPSIEIQKTEAKDPKGATQLIEKIAKVELVFIRAEVLGEYGNKKTVVKIINDYNTQLPLIIKNLDEAIAANDNEPIINALSYLKPYLTAFGMSATLAMLNEVEEESATEKTTKLLSRVFQIRNHIRRAHDETKALIEVLG
ncbi:MAG: hypothetical protein ACKOX3_03125 [Bacteroidota bacterium]